MVCSSVDGEKYGEPHGPKRWDLIRSTKVKPSTFSANRTYGGEAGASDISLWVGCGVGWVQKKIKKHNKKKTPTKRGLQKKKKKSKNTRGGEGRPADGG